MIFGRSNGRIVRERSHGGGMQPKGEMSRVGTRTNCFKIRNG